MHRSFATIFCGIAILWTAAVPAAFGQAGSVGAVSVNVNDPAGAAIPDAALQLKDLNTNVVQKGATGNNGTFTFPYVAFGQYQLTVTKTGFEVAGLQRRNGADGPHHRRQGGAPNRHHPTDHHSGGVNRP